MYRKHYVCVGEKGVSRRVAEKVWSEITPEQVIECATDNVSSDGEITASEIRIKKFYISHGMKKGHPL